MAQVVLNGSVVDVSMLTDEQVETVVAEAVESDNHAAQNVEAESSREWLSQYCDLHVQFFGRLVAA